MSRSIVFADGFESPGGTSGILWKSLGTDATGTLSYWTQVNGAWAIAANVVTSPAANSNLMVGGHADWWDGTYAQRVKWVTGNVFGTVVHCDGSENNWIAARIDGTNLHIDKKVGAVYTADVIAATAAALVNGNQYWIQIAIVGTTYTVKVFNDNAGAINLASQVGSTMTATIADASVQKGVIGLRNFTASAFTAGGAFAAVTQFTGPVPAIGGVNWSPHIASGEPAFCWSKVNPSSGAMSVSIYIANAAGQGDWSLTPTYAAATYTISGWLRGTGAPTIFRFQTDGGATTTPNPAPTDGQWHAESGTAAVPANATVRTIAAGAGTFYWDNLALYLGTPTVAQPTIIRSNGRSVALLGNAPLPNGQGVMPQIDLNDYVNTLLAWLDSGKNIGLDEANRQIGLEQFLYLARGAYVSEDVGPRLINLPMIYIEDASHFLGGFLAAVEQAGEQQLTFDNATYIGVKANATSSRSTARFRNPMAWDFMLELVAAEPWFKDLVASALLPVTLTVDAGQGFVIPYQGAVWCEPVWTLVVPATNTVAINSMVLQNLMSGEALTINFLSYLAIPALTARTITIDTAKGTVTDDLGNFYDHSGAFPRLFAAARQPVVDQFNPFSVQIVPASGSTAGLQLSAAFTPRWLI